MKSKQFGKALDKLSEPITVPKTRKPKFGRMFGRAFGQAFGRTSGRTVVGGARVVSGADKKAFDRGGPVWPPRSNAAGDRLRGVVWGGFASPAKIEKNSKKKF